MDDTICDNTLDTLERLANSPLVSHNQWLQLNGEKRIAIGASVADAQLITNASPKNISMLIHRLRVAEGKLQEFEEMLQPPLIGRWHHANGCLVAGTIRVGNTVVENVIATDDFDTQPCTEFRNEFWNWVCEGMNKLIAFKRRQKEDEDQ